MRHRIYGKHLGRDKDERQNLFRGLVQALLTHGTITTSESKAKATKGLIDKVINLAKEKRTQGRLQSFLTDKNLQERLIKEIVPKLGTRTSGYTSMVRMGSRLGDQTMMVRMSLIGAEQLKPIEKVTGGPRRGRLQGTGRKAEPVKKVVSEKKASGRKPARSMKPMARAKTKSSKK
ncbi:MAG: large subunit ribosomal protein L17 [bacterium]|nr:MAG: large subunit ribosomal protein L17 [bacterium]